MESIKEIFKTGRGPSSSHTMAPARAAGIFLKRQEAASSFIVTLYGSLAATGVGHMTDVALLDVLGRERTKIEFRPDIFLPEHPNGLKFEAFDPLGKRWVNG